MSISSSPGPPDAHSVPIQLCFLFLVSIKSNLCYPFIHGGGNFHWKMGDLSGVTPYKKTDSFSSSYQLPTAPQPGAEIHVHLSSSCWDFRLALACTGLAHDVITSDCICSAVLLCPEHTVFFYSLTIFKSYSLYTSSSTIGTPEPWEEGLQYRCSI